MRHKSSSSGCGVSSRKESTKGIEKVAPRKNYDCVYKGRLLIKGCVALLRKRVNVGKVGAAFESDGE